MDTIVTVLTVLGILAFLLFLGAIVYIVIAKPGTIIISESGPETYSLIEPVPPGGLGFYCTTDGDCDGNYQCDTFWGECKIKLGENCIKSSDCVSNGYCAGKCVDRSVEPNYLSGETGDPCPCKLGGVYICTSNETRKCLLSADQPCADDEDCFSGLCDNNLCADSIPIGQPCDEKAQCSSGNCDTEGIPQVCQPPNINSGDLGAYCNTTSGPGCGENRCQDNICVKPDSGLMLGCGGNSGCPGMMICYSTPQIDCSTDPCGYTGQLAECESINNGSCLCLFNTSTDQGSDKKPQPNVSVQGNCISGQTVSEGNCLSDSGQSCSQNAECSSGACDSGGTIFKINPKMTEGITYSETGLVTMVDLAYKPLQTGIAHANILRLLGYTKDMTSSNGITLDFTTGEDSIFYLGDDNTVHEIGGEGRIISSWNEGTGSSAISYTIKDADAVSLSRTSNSVIYLAVTVTGSFLSYDAIYKADPSNLSVPPIPYLTADGTQTIEGGSGTPLTIDGISTSDFTTSSDVVTDSTTQMLIISGDKIYYKKKTSTTYSDKTSEASGIDSDKFSSKFIKLSYGIDASTSNQSGFAIYPLISYIEYNQSTGDKVLAFSDSVDGDSTYYSDATFPDYMFGDTRVLTDVRKAYIYSLCNTNPSSLDVQNGSLIGSVHLSQSPTFYYISNGIPVYVSGYFDTLNVGMMLTTAKNTYIYNSLTCS